MHAQLWILPNIFYMYKSALFFKNLLDFKFEFSRYNPSQDYSWVDSFTIYGNDANSGEINNDESVENVLLIMLFYLYKIYIIFESLVITFKNSGSYISIKIIGAGVKVNLRTFEIL